MFSTAVRLKVAAETEILCPAPVDRFARTLARVGNVSSGQFLVAFVIAAAVGTAVFFHAEKRGIRHPSAWASFVFLFLIIGLPAYLIHVRRARAG
jgi:predicted PurR-regulated permease PerM